MRWIAPPEPSHHALTSRGTAHTPSSGDVVWTRSRFVRSGFLGGRVAGLYIGYGWIHDILECKFAGRGMVGLYQLQLR